MITLQRRDTPETQPFCGMVGVHPLMLALYEDIRHAAPLDSPVLIEGDTGTGKELIASALHTLSGRCGRLVAVNAAELAEPLAEAELFGAARGSYTGAVAERSGLLMAAQDGTLLLDEAGDLPHALQLKLLRVLESGRVRQVGSERERLVRFRLVISVQRSAQALSECGSWRPDFYYRVAGISLRAPRLAERKRDIPLLANYLLVQLGGAPMAFEDLALLGAHDWPGNVRELRRVVERALHRARGGKLSGKDLLEAIETQTRSHPRNGRLYVESAQRDAERQRIQATLEDLQWDTRTAAGALGMSRSTLYRRMQELGLTPRVTRARARS